MSCSCSSCCSNAAFSCNNASFSIQPKGVCALSSVNPPIPAYAFNLYCPTNCPPVPYCTPSPNHGIGCNAFNGYTPPTCITLPGHTPSCPTCSSICLCPACS